MLATTLLDRIFPVRAQKAVTGPGFVASSVYQPLWTGDWWQGNANRDPRKVMREAQAMYHTHPWVRACENLIGQRFSTTEWHLEDDQDNEVDDKANPAYRAIQELIEHPYRPKPGDPITNTPRTRTQLWKITSRHMGLCNVSAWFLNEIESTGGTPTEILYLNPARLTPGTTGPNGTGQMTHWILDANDRGEGTRLEIREVLLFQLDPPDSGWFGTGLVESAMQKLELTRLSDGLTNSILRTGGKQGGVISPRDGQLNDDEYAQLVNDVRNMNEGPDAAKRWLVLKGPVDYTRTASTPTELDLLALSNMSKEDTLAIWQVPPSQLAVTPPVGLNSAGNKDADSEILQKNAVSPRLGSFRETLQFEFLDRYKVFGLAPEMVIDEPTFDDQSPQYELAHKAENQPLTQKERRELLGLEPFGDDRDEEVWLPLNLVRVYPEEPPKPIPPALAPFTGQPPPVTPEIQMDGEKVAAAIGEKARIPKLEQLRERLRQSMQSDVEKVLAEMRADVAKRAAERYDHLKSKPSDTAVVFDPRPWERRLERALAPHLQQIALMTQERIAPQFGKALADILPAMKNLLGIRIKGISDYTRERVRDLILDGISSGLSPAQLATTLRDAPVFDELRAETIARTETGTLLNLAATQSYRSFGVGKVLVYDSDHDDICAEANGATWTVEEADASPLGHPNCVRSFAPIVGAA